MQTIDQIDSFPWLQKMPISSLLPDECIEFVFSYMNKNTLYKCLFVNKDFSEIAISLIWKDPFKCNPTNVSLTLIDTLLSCLNVEETSLLIPYQIEFNNSRPSSIRYGKYIRTLNHSSCVDYIIAKLGLPHNNRDQDDRISMLVYVIYHMIMRQPDSNLKEFSIGNMRGDIYIDLPKCSTFTAYKPGMTKLKSLKISLGTIDGGYENTIEFLNMVSKSCKSIVDCDLRLNSPFTESFVDIIKSQRLKRLSLCSGLSVHIQGEDKEVIYALNFRSETLRELTFRNLDFRDINLSFMSKLDRLERLELINCKRYLFTEKLHLKELCYDRGDEEYDKLKITGAMINPLLSEELLVLNFRDIVTPEVAKVVRESCPNLKFLQINIDLGKVSNLTIKPICELSLKILKIIAQKNYDVEVSSRPIAKILGDNLIFVECLLLDFHISLLSFKYFTVNCKANLKKLIIYIDPYVKSRKDYLIHVRNYQEVHKSLKLFGIVGYHTRTTKKESEIIDLLKKNQGVGVKFYKRFNLTFEEDILVFSN